MIAQKYRTLLENLEIYAFSYKDNFSQFNLNPFGQNIKPENIFDCTKLASEPFYNLLRKMDAITFGGQAMAMEGWMYFDCSLMPGGIVGFGLSKDKIPNDLLHKLSIPASYTGIVPISMFIAIPMANGAWFGHNLSSLNKELNNAYPGLGILTKALGLKVMNISKMFGATQWNSPAINIHSQLAPMKLITAVTPVHTHRYSLCYQSEYTDENLEFALGEKRRQGMEANFYLMGDDKEKIDQIQRDIEQGIEFTLVGRPIFIDGKNQYPILKKN